MLDGIWDPFADLEEAVTVVRSSHESSRGGSGRGRVAAGCAVAGRTQPQAGHVEAMAPCPNLKAWRVSGVGLDNIDDVADEPRVVVCSARLLRIHSLRNALSVVRALLDTPAARPQHPVGAWDVAQAELAGQLVDCSAREPQIGRAHDPTPMLPGCRWSDSRPLHLPPPPGADRLGVGLSDLAGSRSVLTSLGAIFRQRRRLWVSALT